MEIRTRLTLTAAAALSAGAAVLLAPGPADAAADRPGGAGSVVLHERHTSTAAGSAGTAGARVACLTVPF